MGYYIRVLGVKDAHPSASQLDQVLKAKRLNLTLTVEAGSDADWTQIVLKQPDGIAAASITHDVVGPGTLGEQEIVEFIEGVKDELPKSGSLWLQRFLPRVRVIYAIQILFGADKADGWKAIHLLQSHIWNRVGGIFQADGEGFSNEDGYHILWQFSASASGPWNMAILQPTGKWARFQINLGNKSHREAFQNGELPKGIREQED